MVGNLAKAFQKPFSIWLWKEPEVFFGYLIADCMNLFCGGMEVTSVAAAAILSSPTKSTKSQLRCLTPYRRYRFDFSTKIEHNWWI